MNRTEVESALKRDGIATVPLSAARLIWSSRTQFSKWAKDFGVARHKEENEIITIQHKTAMNPECQRGGPHDKTCVPGDVRMLLSLDGKSFQWLCHQCFDAEIEWRKTDSQHRTAWVPGWKDAKIKQPAPQKVSAN